MSQRKLYLKKKVFIVRHNYKIIIHSFTIDHGSVLGIDIITPDIPIHRPADNKTKYMTNACTVINIWMIYASHTHVQQRHDNTNNSDSGIDSPLLLYPHPHASIKLKGVYWIHVVPASVRLFVRPSVDRIVSNL